MGMFGAMNQRKLGYKRDFQDEVGILMDSRTVVETMDFVSTGILTYAEGDIIEIEIAEFDLFKLGDPVKITIYSLGGIYTLHTSVVAKDTGAIIIINPPENQKKFLGRREYPRVDTKSRGMIKAVSLKESAQRQQLAQPLDIQVTNVSVNGIAFSLLQEGYEIRPNSHVLDVELDAGVAIGCEIEVVRKESSDSGIYYGARILQFPKEKINAFRAFILRTQVQLRAIERKRQFQARSFNK